MATGNHCLSFLSQYSFFKQNFLLVLFSPSIFLFVLLLRDLLTLFPQVRSQFAPGSMVINTGVVVIYFKIPLTLETLSLMGSTSGTIAFCSHNQNIILHSWQNPNKIFASNYTTKDIEPTESFIMFGYGSAVSRFVNRRCAPQNLSKQELKDEVVARSRAEKKMHHTFLALAEKCLVETAFVHVVKKCEAIRPWNDDQVTLIGDAVFKYVVFLAFYFIFSFGGSFSCPGALGISSKNTVVESEVLIAW